MGHADNTVTVEAIERAKEKWAALINLDSVLDEFEGDFDAKAILNAAVMRGEHSLFSDVFFAVRNGLITRLAVADVYDCATKNIPIKVGEPSELATKAANAWAAKLTDSRCAALIGG